MRIKVTCEVSGSRPRSLPADPPPSRDTEGIGAWKPDGEVSKSGFELGRLRVRSSWML